MLYLDYVKFTLRGFKNRNGLSDVYAYVYELHDSWLVKFMYVGTSRRYAPELVQHM